MSMLPSHYMMSDFICAMPNHVIYNPQSWNTKWTVGIDQTVIRELMNICLGLLSNDPHSHEDALVK